MTNVQGRAKSSHQTSALLIILGMPFLPSEAQATSDLLLGSGRHMDPILTSSRTVIRGAPCEWDDIWSFSPVRRAHVGLIARPTGRTWKAQRDGFVSL